MNIVSLFCLLLIIIYIKYILVKIELDMIVDIVNESHKECMRNILKKQSPPTLPLRKVINVTNNKKDKMSLCLLSDDNDTAVIPQANVEKLACANRPVRK
jgi:hypothetical protein